MEQLDKRTQHALQGHSALAKKVFAAVPVDEAWTYLEIHRTMRAMGGTAAHVSAVHACLGQLKDSKIIREPERGKYQRSAATVLVKVDAKRNPDAKPTGTVTPTEAPHIFLQQTPIQEQLGMATLVQEPAVKITTPMDLIMELAEEADNIRAEMNERFDKLRKRMDDVAIQIQTEMADSLEAAQTVAAFQALLAKTGKKQ